MAVELDPEVSVLDGGRTLVGGDPTRVIRLTAAGARTLARLTNRAGVAGAMPTSPGVDALVTRLIDASMIHRQPVPVPLDDVTVVIPAHDRAPALARCLEALMGSLGDHASEVPVVVVDDGSLDPAAVASACRAWDARLVRREQAGGPAAARNTGLAVAETSLVAFLDSDCLPEPGWLELLCGVMQDTSIGAVAPRIRPADPDARVVSRFGAARSPLDMGARPGWVRPGGRISYVPTTALLVRRAALQGVVFDIDLRFGEDVDLIWRIHDAGWRVRYEPGATVRHPEPQRLSALLARHFRYGTAAGPLARRHRRRLTPIVIHPRPMGTVALVLLAPRSTAAVALALYTGASMRQLVRRGVSPAAAARLISTGLLDSVVAIGHATTVYFPCLLALGLGRRRLAPGALVLLLAEPLSSWLRSAPGLDPLCWSALVIADDLAYGAGVWAGALGSTTVAPLRPTLRH